MVGPKILLGDNNSDFLDSFAEALEQAGFHVQKAEGYEQAQSILNEDWVHMAILDMRFIDEKDDNDFSGIRLARQTNPVIPKIILTRYPSWQAVREALRPGEEDLPAVEFISKLSELEERIQQIQQVFKKHVQINWDLRIDWRALDPYSLIRSMEQGISHERLQSRMEELEDLLRMIFFEEQQVRVEELLWQHDGRAAFVLYATKERSLPEAYVIACGLRGRVLDEMSNYKEFAPKGRSLYTTQLIKTKQTAHFAGNLYVFSELAIEDAHTLFDLYEQGQDRQLAAAFNALIQTTLVAWHQNRDLVNEKLTLTELYRKQAGFGEKFSQNTFAERLDTILRHLPELGADAWVRDQILHLSKGRMVDQFLLPYDAPFTDYKDLPPALVTKSPGMVSMHNILTGPEGGAWLTDFHTAGYVPQFWNAIELEAELRFDRTDLGDLQQVYQVERCLVFGDFAHFELTDIEPSLRKSMRTIQEIRRQVARRVVKNPQAYHLGILFQSAARISAFSPDALYMNSEWIQLAHTLIAAAMIQSLLTGEHGLGQKGSLPLTGPIPPIQIDEANQKVLIEGKPVSLTQIEYKILLCLFKKVNKLCSRNEVFQFVYDRDLKSEDDNRMLNVHINRLRGKIEIDKEYPTYLKTRRGEGFVLEVL